MPEFCKCKLYCRDYDRKKKRGRGRGKCVGKPWHIAIGIFHVIRRMGYRKHPIITDFVKGLYPNPRTNPTLLSRLLEDIDIPLLREEADQEYRDSLDSIEEEVK